MSTTVTVAGVNYTIPAFNEQPATGWGTNLSNFFIAVAANIATSPTFMQTVIVSTNSQNMINGKTYLVRTASISVTLNLPTPVVNTWMIVKDWSAAASSHNIVIHRFGSEKIDGSASDKTLNVDNTGLTIFSDGTDWFTIPNLSYYLTLTGGTMSGALAMGANKITGLAAATVAGDALRYEQLFGGDVTLIGNLIFNPTTKGTKGTSTNDNTAAGNIGEYVSSWVDFASVPAPGDYGDKTSISLTAGDWDVSGVLYYTANGATINSTSHIGISTTSGNNFGGMVNGDSTLASIMVSPNATSLAIPCFRMSLASTTTVYLKMRLGAYTVATPTVAGRISARRVR